MSRTPLQIGSALQLGEKSYLITGCIGRGGSSLIYSAYNVLSPDEKVALKELYPNQGHVRDERGQIIPVEDAVWTLERLAQLKAKNRSAKDLNRRANDSNFYVFPVNDIFDSAQLNLPDGSQYTVHNQYSVMNDMQRQGISLTQYIDRYKKTHRGKMPLDQIITLMETVLHSYELLHRDHFIHGDVQPDNIYLMASDPARGQCGSACIIDFGEAWHLQKDGMTRTITADIPLFSTRGYTPPEILYRKAELKLKASADVYSLGVLMLCLAGHCDPYPTERLYSSPYLKRVWDNALLECSQATLGVLNRVLYQALENDPDSRYPDAGAFLAAIGKLKDCHYLAFDCGLTADTLMHGAELRFQHKTAGEYSRQTDPNASEEQLIAKIGKNETCKLQEMLDSDTTGCYRIETEFLDEYTSYLERILSSQMEDGERICVLLDPMALPYDLKKQAAGRVDMLPYMLAEDLLGNTSREAEMAMALFLEQNPGKFSIVLKNLQGISDVSKEIAASLKDTLKALGKAGSQIVILDPVRASPSDKVLYSKEMACSISLLFALMSGGLSIMSMFQRLILKIAVSVVFVLAFLRGGSWLLEKKENLLTNLREAAVSFGERHKLTMDFLYLMILTLTGGMALWMSSLRNEIGVECARYAMYLLTAATIVFCPRNPAGSLRRGIPAAVFAVLALVISKLTFCSFIPGLICVMMHAFCFPGDDILIALLSAAIVLLFSLLSIGQSATGYTQAGGVLMVAWFFLPYVVFGSVGWILGKRKKGVLRFVILIGGIAVACLTLFIHPEIQSGQLIFCKYDWFAEMEKIKELFVSPTPKEWHSTLFGNPLEIKPGWVILGNFLFLGYFVSYFQNYEDIDNLVVVVWLSFAIITFVEMFIPIFTGEIMLPNMIPGMVLLYPLFGNALSYGERIKYAKFTNLGVTPDTGKGKEH